VIKLSMWFILLTGAHQSASSSKVAGGSSRGATGKADQKKSSVNSRKRGVCLKSVNTRMLSVVCKCLLTATIKGLYLASVKNFK